jgi:Cytochrome P450
MHQSFTHALFDLAAYPYYVVALREEVESVINQEGLSNAALGKMRKLDSFLKESQRLHGTPGGMFISITISPTC